jgi:hypothetical protein
VRAEREHGQSEHGNRYATLCPCGPLMATLACPSLPTLLSRPPALTLLRQPARAHASLPGPLRRSQVQPAVEEERTRVPFDYPAAQPDSCSGASARMLLRTICGQTALPVGVCRAEEGRGITSRRHAQRSYRASGRWVVVVKGISRPPCRKSRVVQKLPARHLALEEAAKAPHDCASLSVSAAVIGRRCRAPPAAEGPPPLAWLWKI